MPQFFMGIFHRIVKGLTEDTETWEKDLLILLKNLFLYLNNLLNMKASCRNYSNL
jgi:hypothetical protein